MENLRALLWLAISLHAGRAADSIVLRGVVTDSQNRQPVAGATVSAVGSQARAPDTTDGHGQFDIALRPDVEVGDPIRVRVEKAGYRVYDVKTVASDSVLLQVSLVRLTGNGPPRSDLRLQTEGISQAVKLIAKEQPRFRGEPVFCDTAGLTLIVAHNAVGRVPVIVYDLAFRVEPVEAAANAVDCEVDPLASKPFGIILRNTYILDVSGSSRSGRYIESAESGKSFASNPDNILQLADRKLAISLKPDEEPVPYNVFVVAQKPGLYRVWFTSAYDAAGPRTARTQSFLLAK